MLYGRGVFLGSIKALIPQNMITEAGLACLFLSFVGKKCRSWDDCCSEGSSDVTIVLDVTCTNKGEEDCEDAVRT